LGVVHKNLPLSKFFLLTTNLKVDILSEMLWDRKTLLFWIWLHRPHPRQSPWKENQYFLCILVLSYFFITPSPFSLATTSLSANSYLS
jgi:hypothetical protein